MAKGPKRGALERLVDRVTGAKICFGEPVQVGATAVIGVSRVRAYGGFGFGRDEGDEKDGEGGGGGGYVDAQPLGFIELRSDGTRYQPIDDPERPQKLLKAGVTAVATLLTAAAGARRLRSGRARPARLLGR